MPSSLELLPDRAGENLVLRSPEVGLFTRALPPGSLLAPRATAGVLHSLGRRFELVVPAGATGRVLNARSERVLAPVGYGTMLYELATLEALTSAAAETPGSTGAGTSLVL